MAAQATAAADVAFGMATDKGAAQYAMLLEAVADALPEIVKITGKTIDVSVLKAALRPVHDALISAAVAVAAAPVTAPVSELPAGLVAHGWTLEQRRGKWYASVAVESEEAPIETIGRNNLSAAIADAVFMDKNLRIGVVV
jgi:hypothetical protein